MDDRVLRYNNVAFIESDPVSIPHLFSGREDREIAGFLAATLSWGNRTTILRNSRQLMAQMDFSPYDFVMNSGESEQRALKRFQHRTFNGSDLLFFLAALRNIYQRFGSLEMAFASGGVNDIRSSIGAFRAAFLETPHEQRSVKHLSDPFSASPAKRINMFLRWMVRNDQNGVDLGIWPAFSPEHLLCPLDVHSGAVARRLGLITRKQNDSKALDELMDSLRTFDPHDPVKYDFALFGLGIFEKF